MTVEVNGRPKDISYFHLATLPPPDSVCVTPPPAQELSFKQITASDKKTNCRSI